MSVSEKHRLLLLCPDTVTERMAGPAIRYWEFAKALASDCQVTLATPNEVPPNLTPAPSVYVIQHTIDNIETLCAEHELILFQGYIPEIYPQIFRSGKILIADMYDPIPLESLEQHKGCDADNQRLQTDQVQMINRQLRLADYFLCASERQRDLWLGSLMSLGRINPYNYQEMLERVLVVPFGLPDEAFPQQISGQLRPKLNNQRGLVLLWGGGIWEWFDPLTPIRAVHRLKDTLPDLRLVFLGTRHPNPAIPIMPMQEAARNLARELGVDGKQVIFQDGWVAYEDLPAYLKDADLGVSAHFETLETRFSFRTRILHYLWAGKPVLTTEGDIFAEQVAQYHAGIVLPYKDEQAWVNAIQHFADPDFYARCVTGVQRLAAHYTWSQAVYPLHQLCTHARPAKDIEHTHERQLKVYDLHAEQQRQQQHNHELQQEIERIYRSKSWKITGVLRKLRRLMKLKN